MGQKIWHRYLSKLGGGGGGEGLGGVAYKDRARPPPREYIPVHGSVFEVALTMLQELVSVQ